MIFHACICQALAYTVQLEQQHIDQDCIDQERIDQECINQEHIDQERI